MTQNKIRWCSRGDAINVVKPFTVITDVYKYLPMICSTPESCAEANSLIASGRWHVVKCHLCNNDPSLGTCKCVLN